MSGLSDDEKNKLAAEVANAPLDELLKARDDMKQLAQFMGEINADYQAEALKTLKSETERRESLPPQLALLAEQTDEQALQAAKGSGLTREEVLAMVVNHQNDDMKGATQGSLLSPELVKKITDARESETHYNTTVAFINEQLAKRLPPENLPPEKRPPENSITEWKVNGNNVILNITGSTTGDKVKTLPGVDAGYRSLPGATAGMSTLPGDIAAALDIYKAGHEDNNGGAYMGGHMKFVVSEHTDPFKLPPATNGGAQKPGQKSADIS